MATPLPDPVELAQWLIRCPSVTPEEGGALDLLERVLSQAGFTCHRMIFEDQDTPPVDNLYARFGTASPNICFAGHTDVVPPGDSAQWQHDPFAGTIRDNVLYGRGAVDMKGAIAAFVSAALKYVAAVKSEGVAGSISLLITGDEEGPSINGTIKVLKWLQERGEVLHACIVGEPTNPERLGDEIKIGRRGSLNGTLVVHGKQGHSAYPHLAENPIHKIAHFLQRLTADELDAGSEHFQASSLQVTVVSVPNTATNVIPNEATAKFNIRYNDLWTRDRIEAHIKTLCGEAARQTEARFALEFQGSGDVFLTKPSALVETLCQVVKAQTGRVPKLSTGGGTSDARFIHAHCPVIEFGLINQTMHQVDERVNVEDIRGLTEIYYGFLERYFRE